MQITFLGGADEVGASALLLEVAGRRVLVDAGIRLSPRASRGLAGDQAPDLSVLDAGPLDAILVTHAHTDHTGALELVAERFGCPAYATPVTIALMRVLHGDARRLMQSRLDEEGELPLFDDVSVKKLLDACVPVPLGARLPLADGLAATFFPAGHIAGAAMVGIESDEGRVLVSGDLSISPQRTVDGAKPPPFRPDVLVLESTYGGRMHANRAAEERRLVDTVAQVTAEGGKVLIPAFALGRAQEVILTLDAFRRRGEVGVPVWVDGMVRAVCHAYSAFPEALPLPLQERGARFFDENTRAVQHAVQRSALTQDPAPAVILASSGMLAGGASAAYARALAGDPRNAILLTGYQDEESPGRRLQEIAAAGSGGTLRLGKERVDVRCRLGTYSLSAHADEGQLLSLVEALDPSEVILVHGDGAARESLARRIEERGRRPRLPLTGQSLSFRFRAPLTHRRPTGIGVGQALDMRVLWECVAGPTGGGFFTAEELARTWWGDDERLSEAEAALAADDLYFIAEGRRAGLYRARTTQQIGAQRRRRALLEEWDLAPGHVLLLRDPVSGEPALARCAAVGPGWFTVEGDAAQHGPDDLLDAFDPGSGIPDLESIATRAETLDTTARANTRFAPTPGVARPLAELAAGVPDGASVSGRAALALALLRAGAQRLPGPEQAYALPGKASPVPGAMEPNQALAHVRALFPPETRLRRCGYHTDRRAVSLSFDFPDAVRARHADLLTRAATETGWEIEMDPEANQAALFALARETLSALGLSIVKGPALHREERRVSLAVQGESEGMEDARVGFREATGFLLDVERATAAATPLPTIAAPEGRPWEINAAYAEVKAALSGSTLYRTSLVDGAIVLSFISREVGERYREELAALSQRVGWPLQINPRPNQAAILDVAREIAARAGWQLLAGPSIFTDQDTVALRLAALPEETSSEEAGFTERTGYRLVLSAASAPAPVAAPTTTTPQADVVTIAVESIRLTAAQQGIPLNEAKAMKAVERARRLGAIDPPVEVWRSRDGYVLRDGLYRLHAARALGWDRVPAVVTE